MVVTVGGHGPSVVTLLCFTEVYVGRKRTQPVYQLKIGLLHKLLPGLFLAGNLAKMAS